MEKRGFIKLYSNGKDIVKVVKDGYFGIRFLNSLIAPFVESYWVTLSFLANMDHSVTHIQGLMENKV